MPIDEELSKLIHGDYEAFLDVVWKRDMDCRRATCSLMCLLKHIGPPFWIYCDCGPNGTLHRVPALRVLHQARPSYPGQRRAKPSLRNMCRICEKLWPALPPSARKPRIEARVASYIEQRRAQWAEARQP
jgi:hypothetical protein